MLDLWKREVRATLMFCSMMKLNVALLGLCEVDDRAKKLLSDTTKEIEEHEELLNHLRDSIFNSENIQK